MFHFGNHHLLWIINQYIILFLFSYFVNGMIQDKQINDWQIRQFCIIGYLRKTSMLQVACWSASLRAVVVEFSQMFSLNSVTKILYSKTIIQTCHLLCKRPRCYYSTSKTQVADRIFELSLIHASVIYQIPGIFLIHWISDPFRKNSIVLITMLFGTFHSTVRCSKDGFRCV